VHILVTPFLSIMLSVPLAAPVAQSDRLVPTLANDRTDKDAPSWKKSSTEIDDPSREKLLKATDAPTFKNSNSDTLEPNREIDLRDIDAPRLAKPNTERDEPRRPQFRSDTDDPR
jgi:hypothetical protein